DNNVGYAIPPEGGVSFVIDALVDSLQDIVVHPEVWKKRGEIGRKKAVQLYSWEAKIEQALELYQDLLNT
ncbi:MAG: glycosyltransferase family 4 protein, partial [Proteobacteria bacterium]|nr:glycosyltransferase family 4 protein [Pseudomonadota bacterium]